MPFCTKCGYKLLPNAKFCHKCGAPASKLRCANCGAELPPAANSCHKCGMPLKSPPPMKEISKVPAIAPSKSPVVVAYRRLIRPAAWEQLTGGAQVEHRKHTIKPLEG